MTITCPSCTHHMHIYHESITCLSCDYNHLCSSYRQQTLELERLAEQRRNEDEAWQRQHELLLLAEDQRKKMLELEDQKLTDQRARLAAMKRDAKLKELRSLDDARQRYLEQQQTLRELEIQKMDKEIERKVHEYTVLC